MDTVHVRALELSRLKNGEEKDHFLFLFLFYVSNLNKYRVARSQ